MKRITQVSYLTAAMLLLGVSSHAFDPATEAKEPEQGKTRRIRFKEDDAQNYMVSKIFEIKHLKANDITPFVLGAVVRYASNSSVDRINYSAGKKQLLSVTCPVQMMPYVEKLIATLDRESTKRGPYGSLIAGTGIDRHVFQPKYRSSEDMVTIMTSAGIPSNSTFGANQDAVVNYDSATNLIYWKDSVNKSKDLKKYLTWLDRPTPQVNVKLNVYEVRESKLRDLGIDYLAWKNGPGLDLFGAGYQYLNNKVADALMSQLISSAPDMASLGTSSFGGFFFAPAFDASFVRILQQDGNATISSSASLTVDNGAKSYSVTFTPEYQNLVKGSNDLNSINSSSNNELEMSINNPVICYNMPRDASGLMPFGQDAYAAMSGNFNFDYSMFTKYVVERNNYGNELSDTASFASAVTVALRQEQLLGSYTKESVVEQVVGVPFLCELPVLKYIFGTTTTNREKTHCFITVTVEPIHPDLEISNMSGELVSITELFANK